MTNMQAPTLVVPYHLASSLHGDVWLIGRDWRDAPQTAWRIEELPDPLPRPYACTRYKHGPTLRAPAQQAAQAAWAEVVVTGPAAGSTLAAKPGHVFMTRMLKVAFGPADYDAWALHDMAALVDAAGRVAQRFSIGPRDLLAMPHGFGVNAEDLARPIRRWSEPGRCKRVRQVAPRDRLWWVFHDLGERVSFSTGDVTVIYAA